jgi:hypothetical protein
MFDLNIFILSNRRSDNQSLLKNCQFDSFSEIIGVSNSSEKTLFLSPYFSKFIRIFSENSFEIISYLLNLKFPSKKLKFILIENFYTFGIKLYNIIIQLNFLGPIIFSHKKKILNKFFFFDNYCKEKIHEKFKISLDEFNNFEIFALIKGIFLECIGYISIISPDFFFWVVKLLILYSKMTKFLENKYNWGIFFLFLSECFEKKKEKISINSSLLFMNVNKLKLKYWKFGIYDEFLFLKSFIYSEICLLDIFYSRKKKLSFLIKALNMANYEIFFTGYLGFFYSHQIHFSPKISFFLKINEKNDCKIEKKKINLDGKIFFKNLNIKKEF